MSAERAEHSERPQRASLIASLTEPPTAERLAALPAAVDWLEVRADLVGDLPPGPLAAETGCRLLYTLRSAAEGGASEAAAGRRRERLSAALAAGYDRVDLEVERDLSAELLRKVPADRRVLSWHGAAADLATLEARLASMEETPAALYKLVPAAAQPGEEWAPLLLLAQLGRRDVAAFASGPVGAWTRLLAPRLGAPVVYGAWGSKPAAPGQITIERLIADYGLPELPAIEKVCGIVGNPVAHSLSPRLHNLGYRLLGLPYLYLPFHVEAFGEFWLEVVEGVGFDALGLGLAGLSITTPHKDSALAVAGAPSPLAQLCGGANTLVPRGGVWEAETTDPEGVTLPLAERGIPLTGRPVAVVGAGRAGAAAAAGLRAAGAAVTLVNRDGERARRVAARLHVAAQPLAGFDPGPFAVVVNATSVGRAPGAAPAISVAAMAPGAVLVDLVYGDAETALVRAARERGLTVVDGREVLLAQARAQFRSMTGAELPVAACREVLGLKAPGEASP